MSSSKSKHSKGKHRQKEQGSKVAQIQPEDNQDVEGDEDGQMTQFHADWTIWDWDHDLERWFTMKEVTPGQWEYYLYEGNNDKKSRPAPVRYSLHLTGEATRAWISVWFRTSKGDYFESSILMDTGCFKGNWIAENIVDMLGFSDRIRFDFPAPHAHSLEGWVLPDKGAIKCSYITAPRNRVETRLFFILAKEAGIDGVFGLEHLVKTGAFDPAAARSALIAYGATAPFAARIDASGPPSKEVKKEAQANKLSSEDEARRLKEWREQREDQAEYWRQYGYHDDSQQASGSGSGYHYDPYTGNKTGGRHQENPWRE